MGHSKNVATSQLPNAWHRFVGSPQRARSSRFSIERFGSTQSRATSSATRGRSSRPRSSGRRSARSAFASDSALSASTGPSPSSSAFGGPSRVCWAFACGLPFQKPTSSPAPSSPSPTTRTTDPTRASVVRLRPRFTTTWSLRRRAPYRRLGRAPMLWLSSKSFRSRSCISTSNGGFRCLFRPAWLRRHLGLTDISV